jgi:CubicO group peptidase (beta-lactamase class C family)
MIMRLRWLMLLGFSAGVSAAQSVAPLPVASPEAVGMSSERLERLDAFVGDLIHRDRIAGAITAIARRGRLVHWKAQGMADIASHRAMRQDDIFAFASMTKPVTAAAVMLLVEEGRLRLSDPLEKFLPEFRAMKVAVPDPHAPEGYVLEPAKRSITIHDLLTHRSGFMGPPASRSPAAVLERKIAQGWPKNPTLAQYAIGVAQAPLDNQPGAAWEYGASFAVLGRVIEVVSGQSFPEFLRQRLFEPLRMVDTGFVVPEQQRSRVVTRYEAKLGGGLEASAPSFGEGSFPSGSGGLFSTASDYLRFCQMLLNGGELDGHRMLSRKSIELMASPHVAAIPLSFLPGQGYGLGVAVQQPGGEGGVLGSPGTYGWSGAYNTYFRIDPHEQLIVLLLVQLSPANDLEIQYGFQNVAMQAIVD